MIEEKNYYGNLCTEMYEILHAEAYIEKRIKLEIQNAINEVAMQTAIDIVKRGGNIELSEHSKSQGNRTGE